MSKVEARTVLWYLAFFGFAINYMIRINTNITIVEMVLPKTSKISNINVTVSVGLSNNETFRSHNISQTSQGTETHKRGNRFDWNESQQGQILGSFYYLHWATQIPGGILAKKYGTKLIFGLGNVVGCWLCLIVPLASQWDYRALLIIRVLQGLVTGLTWPAMHVLTAKWIPPNERSKFVTAYLGSSVGMAIFYPLFGYIMHWLSWEWVFYISGIVGTIWWFGWLIFVFDSPEQHPRIQDAEVRYIAKSLGDTVNQGKQHSTPWKAILTSRAVWMNVIAQWGGIWGLFTLMTQAPTYFRFIHHWDIRSTGILSGLPHIMRMFVAYVFSTYADYLLRTEKMSRTNVRKLATSICTIVHGVLVLALAYFGYDSTAAIVLTIAATGVHGTVSSGPLASVVDLSPNYAGIVLGVCGMIGVIPGFISPIIVGILTLNNQTYEAWRNVFCITAGMLIFCGSIYVMFAESNIQSWNSPDPNLGQKEMTLLENNKSSALQSIAENENEAPISLHLRVLTLKKGRNKIMLSAVDFVYKHNYTKK